MLQDPNSLMGILTQYGRAVGWSIAAAVGFAFGQRGYTHRPWCTGHASPGSRSPTLW